MNNSSIIEEVSGKQLDYKMYEYACRVLDRKPSVESFEKGYSNGQFHFSTDASLLVDLMQRYKINLQQLAGEWLASTTQGSVYSPNPVEAACRLVLKLYA